MSARVADPAPIEREIARLIVTGALSMGSVFLTAFGLLERVVGFEALADRGEVRFAGLLPGAAALSFLASARALTSLYASAEAGLERALRGRIRARLEVLSGAFALFAFVLSALVGVSAGLSLALALPGLTGTVVQAASAFGLAAFAVTFGGILTRPGLGQMGADALLAAAILMTMAFDLFL